MEEMQEKNEAGTTNATLTMKGMVDAALGTPEVGAVNFNVLHSLLHAILNKMEIGDTKVQVKGDENKDGLNGNEKNLMITPLPYHQLQERIKNMESQIGDLNSMPKNNDILSGFISSKPEETKRTVSDLWQVLSLRKKVGANEEGVDRLSSLMDQILSEMRQLKQENQSMKQKLEDLSGLKSLNDKLNGLENDLANLRGDFNNLRDLFSQYPSPDSFKNVVTWEGLENALKGVKDAVEQLKKPTEKVFINMATEPMSRPPSSQSSSGPSQALADMLEKLGHLTDAHDELDKRVIILEEVMPTKADKSELENLKVPDDLLKLINQLKSQVDQLMNSKNKDTEALARMREILNGLQDRMKDMNQIVEKIEEENKEINKHIQDLFEVTKDQENRKADITYVDSLLRNKADKSLLDSKVGLDLFDETTNNLHSLIDELMKKLMVTEEELRDLFKTLSDDMDNKVDKDDLNSLREWIEKRLRQLAEKLKNSRGFDMSTDEAAGLRKQLMQHFHCVSCDRPLDVAMHGYNANDKLAENKGLPANKSMRPYTTYELEAIRQQAKTMHSTRVVNPRYFSSGPDIIDVYQTPRPCGGSHTTTWTHKRQSKYNNAYVEDDPNSGYKLPKEELDIQGTDGHIYKGRLERGQTTIGNLTTNFNPNNLVTNNTNNMSTDPDKLPPVNLSQSRSPTVIPKSGFVTRPKSAVKITPRPSSGVQRPGSVGGGNSSRPTSARQGGERKADPTKLESALNNIDEQTPTQPIPTPMEEQPSLRVEIDAKQTNESPNQKEKIVEVINQVEMVEIETVDINVSDSQPVENAVSTQGNNDNNENKESK